jgi:hypothetical protein
MQEKDAVLIIRIKPKTKRLLRWLAGKNNRTMTGHILALIEQDARTQEKQKEPQAETA